MTKRILIVDDDRDLTSILARRCAALGLVAATAHDAPEALSMIQAASPDLICLDVTLPSGDGICLCETLAADEKLSKTPVIILTGRSDEEVVRRCHALCAYYVPKCADVWPRIEPLLHELLGPLSAAPAFDRQLSAVDAIFDILAVEQLAAPDVTAQPDERAAGGHSASPPWVLHIDDDLEFSRALKIRLEQHGVAVVRAEEGMQGYRSAFSYPADAILLDYSLPNGQGDYVLRRLKENPVTKDIPVIVLTGNSNRSLERKMMNIGAARFLAKPLKFDELLEALSDYMDVLPTSAMACPV
ncbi:MAG: response regulator [Planctomycetes bacterium]|nr:response regulator [Planctomycetota bacterium]